MGKKKTEDVDALADFFGGDVDWLLEDDNTADLETGEELPVAPLPKSDPTALPPTPLEPEPAALAPTEPASSPRTATPFPEPAAAELPVDEDTDVDPTVSIPGLLGPVDFPTAELELDPPSEELTAPFASGVPKAAPPPPPELDRSQLEAAPVIERLLGTDTIVPAEAPAAGAPAAEAPVPEALASEAPVAEVPANEVPANEVPANEAPVTEALAAEAPVAETPAAELVVVSPAEAVAEAGAPVAEPVIEEQIPLGLDVLASEAPVPEPAPAPVVLDDADEVELELELPLPSPTRKYAPSDEPTEWREAVAVLVAEAEVAPEADRAALLFWAARLDRRRLGDEGGAMGLLQDAAVAGYSDWRLHRERANAALLEERWADAELAFADLAASREGSARSEAYQDAAGMAAQRGDPKSAARWLRAATEADPTDYIAWSLLRDQCASTGDEAGRAEAIEQVAALAPDAVAADALWERGTVLHALGDPDRARGEWHKALDRWPSHAPALLSLRASSLETSDHAGRGALYEREATRPAQTDTGWWYLKAARAWREAGNDTRARNLFTAAAGMGDPLARRELQAFLHVRGDHAGLAEALEDEINREKDRAARAFAAWRLGIVRERHLGNRDGARAAYAQAVDIDPATEPAAEALARLLEEDGGAGLLDAWEQQAASADEDRARALRCRMAETAERMGLPERARDAWERILAVDPKDGLALEGAARAADQLGDAQALTAARNRLAEHAPDPREAAAWRYLAATGTPTVQDLPALRAAALGDPDNLVVHVVAVRALLAADDAAGAIEVLEAFASHHTGARAARAWYRAARIAHERLRDPDHAQRDIARALEADAHLRPAVTLVREIADRRGASRDLAERHRHRGEAASDPAVRVWWRVAAALAAEGVEGANPEADLDAVLADDPLHGGALALREIRALERRDWSALAKAWRAAVDSDGDLRRRASRLAWLAELLQEIGDLDGARWALQELTQHNPGDAPLRGAARIAAAQHDWREAASLLRRAGEPEDLLERARILGHYVGDVPTALAAWRDLLADGVFGPAAAVGLLQVASAAGDVTATRAAHRVLSAAGEPAFRAAHLAWAADLEEDEGDLDAALRLHREVLALRPNSRTTFDAIRKILVGRRDTEALEALWAACQPDDLRGLAEDLEATGDFEAAARAWRRAGTADGALPTLIEVERALVRVGDWRGVFDVLRRQEAVVRDPSTLKALEARKRWVLGEKLTGSAEAWDVYRSLHDEHPGDREVEKALARIAAERGEMDLAVQLWTELSVTSRDPGEAAALRRRVAMAAEQAGDHEAARQAYVEALELRPDDIEAISGLERLARQSSDDRAVEAALHRRAALIAPGADRAMVLREIARLVEGRGDDLPGAAESWRRVLEQVPDDIEALERLVAMAASSANWAAFVDHATALATVLDGPERGALLRRVGIACEDHLHRDPVPFYESAVREDPPDREALHRLERVLEKRGDEAGVVRCLKVEASLPEVGPGTRVELLARAATLESSILHEREVAADLWRQVLELDPQHRDALAWLSGWLYEQGRLEAAAPLFERLEPHLTEGRDLTDFDARVEIAVQRFRFGQLLARIGRTDEALKRYEWALELNPTHLPSLEAAAPLYERVGRFEDAERAWRQVLQLIGGTGDGERTAEAYAHLGHVERSRGDGEKAFKRFNKALELCPNHVGALRGLAAVFEDRQDWDNCMKSWNNVIYHATKREDVVQAYLTKGRLLDDRLGRPDKAAEHYQRCLDVDQAQPGALLRLAELSLRTSDWRAAEAWAHRGLRQEPEPPLRAELLVSWALARNGQGDRDGAVTAIAEASALIPPLGTALGADPLADVPAVVRGLHERLE